MMLKPTIEFCTSNMHHGTERLLDKYEDDDDFEAVEYGCLGNCTECYLKPYALVNGSYVAADSVDELEKAIEQFLEDEQKQQDELDKLLDLL